MGKHKDIEKSVVMVVGDKGFVKLKEAETPKTTIKGNLRRNKSKALSNAVFG